MRCGAQARAAKCPAEKGWRWVALEGSERTRTRTETQREEVGQPHTQSFGHRTQRNVVQTSSLDGYAGYHTRRRRKRRIQRILAWIASPRASDTRRLGTRGHGPRRARHAVRGHTVDWARPSTTHVAKRKLMRRHVSNPPTQPPVHASRGEKINLAGR